MFVCVCGCFLLFFRAMRFVGVLHVFNEVFYCHGI